MASGDALKCAYLLVAGEMDELTPPEDVHAWLDRLNGRKNYGCTRMSSIPWAKSLQIFTRIADWIADVLEKGLPDGHDLRREIVP